VSPKRDIVRRARVFSDLSDEECDAVAAVFKPIRGPAGATLFSEGDPGDAMMIVTEGSLTVKVKTPAGQEEVVRRVGPGDVIGEMSFFDAKPRSATLTTSEGATLLAFTREAMRKLRSDSPRVAAAIHRGILKDLAHRLRDLAVKTSDGVVLAREAGVESSAARPGMTLTPAQLQSFPALRGYSKEDLSLLAQACTHRTFAAQEVLMEQGKKGDACWLLLSGKVVATMDRQATPLATLGPGSLVGQLALLDGTVRSATVTASVRTEALEVKGAAFAFLLRDHSPIALRFQEQVALSGIGQLRTATNKFAAHADERGAASVGASRTLDWDPGNLGDLELELDLSGPKLKR